MRDNVPKPCIFNDIEISKLVLGPIETNCYILIESKSGNAIVVDPADDGEVIAERLSRRKARLQSIVLTHGHFDHIGGINGLSKHFPADVCIHAQDGDMITDAGKNFSLFTGHPIENAPAGCFLSDGMKIALGDDGLLVAHTPGHTQGSICLVGRGFVMTGDTLFRNSVGRTDLPGSSMDMLMHSIRNRLMLLDDETVVFSGHGDETTIGHERKRNPFLA